MSAKTKDPEKKINSTNSLSCLNRGNESEKNESMGKSKVGVIYARVSSVGDRQRTEK